MFECYVIRCGSKNEHYNYISVKKIGLQSMSSKCDNHYRFDSRHDCVCVCVWDIYDC